MRIKPNDTPSAATTAIPGAVAKTTASKDTSDAAAKKPDRGTDIAAGLKRFSGELDKRGLPDIGAHAANIEEAVEVAAKLEKEREGEFFAALVKSDPRTIHTLPAAYVDRFKTMAAEDVSSRITDAVLQDDSIAWPDKSDAIDTFTDKLDKRMKQYAMKQTFRLARNGVGAAKRQVDSVLGDSKQPAKVQASIRALLATEPETNTHSMGKALMRAYGLEPHQVFSEDITDALQDQSDSLGKAGSKLSRSLMFVPLDNDFVYRHFGSLPQTARDAALAKLGARPGSFLEHSMRAAKESADDIESNYGLFNTAASLVMTPLAGTLYCAATSAISDATSGQVIGTAKALEAGGLATAKDVARAEHARTVGRILGAFSIISKVKPAAGSLAVGVSASREAVTRSVARELASKLTSSVQSVAVAEGQRRAQSQASKALVDALSTAASPTTQASVADLQDRAFISQAVTKLEAPGGPELMQAMLQGIAGEGVVGVDVLRSLTSFLSDGGLAGADASPQAVRVAIGRAIRQTSRR